MIRLNQPNGSLRYSDDAIADAITDAVMDQLRVEPRTDGNITKNPKNALDHVENVLHHAGNLFKGLDHVLKNANKRVPKR